MNYRIIEKTFEFGTYRVRVVINETTEETAFFQFFTDPTQEQIDSAVNNLLQSQSHPPVSSDPLQQLSQRVDNLSDTVQNLNSVIPGNRISARQIRLWLINNGISLDNIIQIINSIQDPLLRDSIMVEWEYAPYIERNHPMLIPLAANLGLSENDIDRAFLEASTI